MNMIVLIAGLPEITMFVGLAPEKVAILLGAACGDQLPGVDGFQLLPGPAQVASCG